MVSKCRARQEDLGRGGRSRENLGVARGGFRGIGGVLDISPAVIQLLGSGVQFEGRCDRLWASEHVE